MISSGEEQFHERKRQVRALVGQWYAENFWLKRPCRTTFLQGLQWVQELVQEGFYCTFLYVE